MAAAFTTTASTIEGQVLELAREIQELELAIPEETRPNNIGIAIDLEALTATVNITLPIVLSGTGNSMSIAASAYLT